MLHPRSNHQPTEKPSLNWATLFSPGKGNKVNRTRHLVKESGWQYLHIPLYLSEHQEKYQIRFHPLNRPGVVRIASIRTMDMTTNMTCWEASNKQDFDAIDISDMAVRLPDKDHLLLVIICPEAQIFWNFRQDIVDCSMAQEIIFRVDPDIDFSSIDIKELSGVLKTLLRQGRYVDTLHIYDLCPGLNFANSGDPELLTWLIPVLDESGRLLEAATCYMQAMSANLAVALFPMDIGRKLEHLGAWNEADNFYSHAVEFYEKRIDVRAAKVRVLRKLGRFHEAEQFANLELNKFSNSAGLRIDLGVQKLEEHDTQAALEFFQSAQKLNFDFPLWVSRAISALSREMLDVYGVRLHVPAELVSPSVLLPMIKGRYERSEMMFIMNVIEPGDRVLELGGGIGFLACYLHSNIPNVHMCIVEANSKLLPLLEKNLQLNSCCADTIQGLAAIHDGDASFNVSENFWSSSVLDIPTPYVAQNVKAIDSNRLIKEFMPNKMIIDIEGGEVGLIPALDLSNIDALIIEVHQRYTGINGVNTVFFALMNKGFMFDLEFSQGNVFTFFKHKMHEAHGDISKFD